MSARNIARAIQAAIAAGILPADAADPSPKHGWTLAVVSGVGVWLAALPSLALVVVMMPSAWITPPGLWTLGLLILCAALWGLHSNVQGVAAEQLCLMGLLIGSGLICWALDRTNVVYSMYVPVAALATCLAFLTPRYWLHALFSAAALVLWELALLRAMHWRAVVWWYSASLIPLAIWLMVQTAAGVLAQYQGAMKLAAKLDGFASGWAAMLLVYLACAAGETFLLGPLLRLDFAPQGPGGVIDRTISLALAGVACIWWRICLPALPIGGFIATAFVALGLAWLAPSLGPVLLICVIALRYGHRNLAIAAGVAAGWVVGALYYSLAFPLAHTAVLLLVAGLVLAAVAWQPARLLFQQHFQGPGTERSERTEHWMRHGVWLSAALVLVVVNAGIWQKERTIAQGKTVHIALAPADPRSLMQGDFMRLRFNLPVDLDAAGQPGQTRLAIGNVDADGLLTILRFAGSEPLQAGEMAIELTRGQYGWIVVTDAWHFAEGDGGRWARARFGEFRVASDGKAVLVNLKGAKLEAL